MEFYDHIYKQYLNKNSIRQDMMKKYCLDKDKKNIIIALPQLGEHGELPWNRHWKEINFLIETLESLNHNTLISLHPKMNEKEYKFLEKKYNCKILSERLFDVIPSADLFVATYSAQSYGQSYVVLILLLLIFMVSITLCLIT